MSIDEKKPMNPAIDRVVMPATQMPAWRTKYAIERGKERNVLITTWGGIGDQLCSEPTIRFAIDTFKDCEISLASEIPEFFSHLKFKKVYDLKVHRPNLENYFVFETITKLSDLTWQFVNHCITHCVDFPSLCAFKCTLPIEYKSINVEPKVSETFCKEHSHLLMKPYVFFHAGKHWQSKTFSSEWWNRVLWEMKELGQIPVVIGKEVASDQGTVEVDTSGCVDLRDQTSIEETLWLLKNCTALITNDSSPLHMAATGNAHIAFVASCKHQDFIYHWRKDQWAWRMKHFNRGGLWETIDHIPNKEKDVLIDKCDEELKSSWLPEPNEMPQWVSHVTQN